MSLSIALISLYVFENNGVRILAAALRDAGFTVNEIYFKDYLHHRFIPPTDKEIARLKQVLEDTKPGLVGVSLRAGAYLQAARPIVKMIRQDLKFPVIMGGPHTTFDREKLIHEVDYLAVGEAEESFVDLARTIETGGDAANVRGVWANRGGEIRRNPVRPLIQDLDRIPFRDYHSDDFKWVIDGQRFDKGDPVTGEHVYITMASRGCVYNCTFCDTNILKKLYKGLGKYYRVRSVDNVLDEIDYARRYFPNMRRVRFDDELFPYDRSWLEEFSAKYKKRFDYPFDILSDPRVMNEKDIILLKDAGMDRILLGIQASDDVNRRLFNRSHSDEKIIELSRVLARHKIHSGYQVIVDIPTTTQKDQQDLLELLLSMQRPYDIYSFSLNLWPGTELTRRFLKEGVITGDEIAGSSDKAIRQFRADFSFERNPEDQLWIALFHLTSKGFIPKSLIRRMSQSVWLKKNPRPAIWLSEFANFIKLGFTALDMIKRRELTWTMVRRFLNFKSPVSI
jgi:radical SAM superfamily enzyme YgiQ (UPF0313 family)